MSSCTFFGHRYVGKGIETDLICCIEKLIIENYLRVFYVGNQGEFDNLVRKVLKKLKNKYLDIKYYVVLAYMLCEKDKEVNDDFTDTLFIDELAYTPRKFAIHKRNMWMICRWDYVVTYVNNMVGGAAMFQEIAFKKGKNVINIANCST